MRKIEKFANYKISESMDIQSFKDIFQELIDLGIGEIDIQEDARETTLQINHLSGVSIADMAELYKVLSFCNDRLSDEYSGTFRPKESCIFVIYSKIKENDELVKIDKKEFDSSLKNPNYKPTRTEYYKLNSFLVNYKQGFRVSPYDINNCINIFYTKDPNATYNIFDISHNYYISEVIRYYNQTVTNYYKCSDMKTIIKYLDEKY